MNIVLCLSFHEKSLYSSFNIAQYSRLGTGFCNLRISSEYECEEAAKSLGLKFTTASDYSTPGRPRGCIYAASNEWLIWNPEESDHECGTVDSYETYNCLCDDSTCKLFIRIINLNIEGIQCASILNLQLL